MFGINSAEFIPFLTMGLAIWNAIIAANVESCGIFLQNRNYVQQFPLPRQIFIFRFVWAQLYYFWISICAGMVIIILFSKIYLMGLLYAVPGLLILSAYFVFSSTVLAYAGCRYRDLQYALGNLFSILFIVTPIIFPTEILAKKGINVVLYLNPFISLIEIIRYPLLHGQVPAMQYYVTSLALVLGLAVTRIFVIKYWDKKLIFWL
jgi:ABC-type polysaccharide/polyol phosphate export permease